MSSVDHSSSSGCCNRSALHFRTDRGDKPQSISCIRLKVRRYYYLNLGNSISVAYQKQEQWLLRLPSPSLCQTAHRAVGVGPAASPFCGIESRVDENRSRTSSLQPVLARWVTWPEGLQLIGSGEREFMTEGRCWPCRRPAGWRLGGFVLHFGTTSMRRSSNTTMR
jgi:hypothetical protein